jgi:hypothetical protein
MSTHVYFNVMFQRENEPPDKPHFLPLRVYVDGSGCDFTDDDICVELYVSDPRVEQIATILKDKYQTECKILTCIVTPNEINRIEMITMMLDMLGDVQK